MAVPKKKTSKAVKRARRAHLALSPLNFSRCSNCGTPRLPHSVCESCGFYKQRTVPTHYLKSDLLKPLR